MVRCARVVVPGSPHHITQRGIRRFDIFRDSDDRKLYLRLFEENSQRFGLRICAYCLMTNHVHYVAIPERPDSIWKTLHRCHGIYAARFNLKYGLVGHLFQGRAFSSVLDTRHFWSAVRYVERNPVRARMVARPQDYEWSSAAAHCGLSEDPLLDREWNLRDDIDDWTQWLADPDDDDYLRQIRSNTRKGRPCGDQVFIRSLELETGRTLQPQKRGPRFPKFRGPSPN